MVYIYKVISCGDVITLSLRTGRQLLLQPNTCVRIMMIAIFNSHIFMMRGNLSKKQPSIGLPAALSLRKIFLIYRGMLNNSAGERQ